MKRQPMTCWRVLHKTTTKKVKGSIMGGGGRWKAGGGRAQMKIKMKMKENRGPKTKAIPDIRF